MSLGNRIMLDGLTLYFLRLRGMYEEAFPAVDFSLGPLLCLIFVGDGDGFVARGYGLRCTSQLIQLIHIPIVLRLMVSCRLGMIFGKCLCIPHRVFDGQERL
jgi:hypothetical protein